MSTNSKVQVTTGTKKSDEDEWVYEYISQYIKSPTLRVPIKDFVDENCNTFFSEGENSFQQTALHNEFKLLIENLLEKMLQEVGASQEQFLLAARKGLESEADKKYFEQLIACENYIYFKNMMIKRNMQLEEQAFQLMKSGGDGSKENKTTPKTSITSPTTVTPSINPLSETDPQLAELKKLREKAELDCAIQMSLALEEEKKRLMAIEEDDLRRAIELSKSANAPKNNREEELSLFDPSTLKSKGDLSSSSGVRPAPIHQNPPKTFTNTVSSSNNMSIAPSKKQVEKSIVTPTVSGSINSFSITSTNQTEKIFSKSNNTTVPHSQNTFEISNKTPKPSEVKVVKQEKPVTTSVNNQWKIDDHLGKDYIPSESNEQITSTKEYVNKTLEKSEKLEFKETGNVNLIDFGNEKQSQDSESKVKETVINLDKGTINQIFEQPKTEVKPVQFNIVNDKPKQVDIHKTKQVIPTVTQVPTKIEGAIIDDNVDFNNQFNLLSSINSNTNIKPSQTVTAPKQTQQTNLPTQELTFEDFSNSNKNSTNEIHNKTQNLNNNNFMSMSVNSANTQNKLNLGQLKSKKALDTAFGLDTNLDSGLTKSIINQTHNINLNTNTEVTNNLPNQSDLAKVYEDLEKEQQNQIKDYRDLLLKMKKDKRSDQQEKDKEKTKEDDLFKIDDNQLSDEVKKRIQMRKLLADKLKK